MRFYGSFFLFITLFITITHQASADELIIEPDMGRAPILKALQAAQHSIDLVMYGFTDKTILHTFLQQKALGKNIRIILEKNPYKTEKENIRVINKLTENHIAWIGAVPPFRLVHEKVLLVDNQQAMIMTFNFTHASFKKQRNFALIIDNPQELKEIATIFNAHWNHLRTKNQDANLLLSPDNSRPALLALIAAAKSSIKIYAQNISDYKVAGALARAAKVGVSVQILTSGALHGKQFTYLTQSGVLLRSDKKMLIHAKVILIDNQEAVLGSINLTRSSLDDNRELSIVSHDANILKQLNTIFTSDWNNA